MFKPHFGICKCGCGQPGVVVVKKGLIKKCNERYKKQKKAVSAVRQVIKSEKQKSVPWLIGKLDDVFSLYIRYKNANEKGLIKCYTCPEILPIKQMQCGHYVSRKHFSLRWEERNCKPQCFRCNIHLKGNYTVFADKMNREKPGEIERLEIMKYNTFKLDRFILQTLITQYTVKLNHLWKKK